jgi:hypothetical protein
MARLGLKINNDVRYLDDGAEQILGTIHGISIRQTGPFIYATGQGDNTGNTNGGTSNIIISKLCPPSPSALDIPQAYGNGLVDAGDVNAINRMTMERNSGTYTKTGSGKVISHAISSYKNSRPFLVGLVGDGTTQNRHTLKINNVSKNNLIPAPEDHEGSLYRYAKRQEIQMNVGFSGSLYCSKFGSVVIMQLTKGTATFPQGETSLLASTLPEEFRPSVNVYFPIAHTPAQQNPSWFIGTAYADGRVTVRRVIAAGTIQFDPNVSGIGIWSTNTVDAPPLFKKVKLKMNGIEKEFTQLNNTELTTQHTYVAGVNKGENFGVCRLWRLGNFVFGNAHHFTPQTPTNPSANYFVIPEAWRPLEETYSCAGALEASGSTEGMDNYRTRYKIGTDGVVSGVNTFSGGSIYHYLSFYYYCNR